MVDEFKDDDTGYLDWLRLHPDGFVVNLLRSGRAVEPVLHRANCWTINGTPSNGRTWTGQYYKICGVKRSDAVQQASKKAQAMVKECRWCSP